MIVNELIIRVEKAEFRRKGKVSVARRATELSEFTNC